MRHYELYFNGNRMDMGKGFNFVLLYQSPIFTDISKIVSNRTSTIRLPKTINNLRVIENCQIPNSDAQAPYKTHNCEIWCNGVPIVQRGVAMIFGITNQIEISIVWGNRSNTEAIFEKRLRELASEDRDYIRWDNNLQYLSNQLTSVGFLHMDFGQGAGNKQYTHPVVSFKYLLDKISTDSGLQIEYSLKWRDLFNLTYVPLLEKNTDERATSQNTPRFYIDRNVNIVELSDPINAIQGNSFVAWEDGEAYFTGQQTFQTTEVLGSSHTANIRIYNNNISTTAPVRIISGLVQSISIGDERYELQIQFDFTDSDSIFNVQKGGLIVWYIEIDGSPFGSSKLQAASGEIWFHINSNNVPFGGIFPIVPNLPDITCMDALRSIMTMYGLFAYYDINNPDVMRLFSIDDIYSRIPGAVDWTHKLVTGNSFDEITFTFQDYARENYLRYLNDSTVQVNADGAIQVRNDNLIREKDIAELKYAPSDNRNGFAYIPLYTSESDGIKFNKLSNRVLYPEFYNNHFRGVFSNLLHFAGDNGLIKNYYSKFQDVIYQPKVIKGRFLLNEIDLLGISLLTPIYLEQTGKYYAIIKIQSEINGIASCELIQL